MKILEIKVAVGELKKEFKDLDEALAWACYEIEKNRGNETETKSEAI